MLDEEGKERIHESDHLAEGSREMQSQSFLFGKSQFDFALPVKIRVLWIQRIRINNNRKQDYHSEMSDGPAFYMQI